nr:immunoglobulin heavy chain junction region [Macaca mulatta]MOV86862.1 immunoglobulin heavy chain junction region [Macaca mulatta]MOV87048.1 immunoglobulin heavy chain junction region [Macaca mulatta]MOV87298.1 immunoglobulin heavy chain junction region [Macaca mulatta]MOV87337.1 immunoglobulin heavy chain junction region [Macaca mulatta]
CVKAAGGFYCSSGACGLDSW